MYINQIQLILILKLKSKLFNKSYFIDNLANIINSYPKIRIKKKTFELRLLKFTQQVRKCNCLDIYIYFNKQTKKHYYAESCFT